MAMPRVPASLGSSPRPRGTLPIMFPCRPMRRLIPAPAGNTAPGRTVPQAAPAHPRARGEHVYAICDCGIRIGSSPRPRGTPRGMRHEFCCARLIPAPAGNTDGADRAVDGNEAHPRARGEHIPRGAHIHHRDGSSPRPRGTRHDRGEVSKVSRLIPAPAGNTLGSSDPSCAPSAHPRARGEHAPVRARLASTCGSSPRPRGTPGQDAQQPSHLRLIPAPAGNTARHSLNCALSAAHPRARGEHPATFVHADYPDGSSPRPRGTPDSAGQTFADCRLIPAPAGNTENGVPTMALASAHPRARGEHFRWGSRFRSRGGSSPRPRGTQRDSS